MNVLVTYSSDKMDVILELLSKGVFVAICIMYLLAPGPFFGFLQYT